MKGKQFILLFLALLFPSCIFIFLKFFGKNEFDVAPLFTTEVPAWTDSCSVSYKIPYVVSDTIVAQVIGRQDSIGLVIFRQELPGPLQRVLEKYEKEPIRWNYLDQEEKSLRSRCIFVVAAPLDVALIDRKGQIRGQYNSSDRDDVDRLITELAILLKKY